MLVEKLGAVDALAFEDDHRDALGGGDVVERISVDDEEIGVVAGMDGAGVVVDPEQASGVPGCGLQGHGGRDAGPHPELKFMLHGGAVDHKKVACIAACDQ